MTLRRNYHFVNKILNFSVDCRNFFFKSHYHRFISTAGNLAQGAKGVVSFLLKRFEMGAVLRIHFVIQFFSLGMASEKLKILREALIVHQLHKSYGHLVTLIVFTAK